MDLFLASEARGVDYRELIGERDLYTDSELASVMKPETFLLLTGVVNLEFSIEIITKLAVFVFRFILRCIKLIVSMTKNSSYEKIAFLIS